MDSLILVSNPGASSRKYALYKKGVQRIKIHFEYEKLQIKCHIFSAKFSETRVCNIKTIEDSIKLVEPILREFKLVSEKEIISRVGLRIVAPSEYFLQNRLIDDEALRQLNILKSRAPLHISASITELKAIKSNFGSLDVVGISDSSFHVTKPDFAWNYGVDIDLANTIGIKRYGYHGISAASVTRKLSYDLPDRMVVCHLGSGASVTAVKHGVSVDNTMGYSPLEGLVMSTRSGSIDLGAAMAIKNHLKLDDAGIENYLNKECGLLGLSKQSDDIRYLIERYEAKDPLASLALRTFAYNVKKAIGQMIATLNGIDTLVFTGTAGTRSAFIRRLIVSDLDYFGLNIDNKRNNKCHDPLAPTVISTRTRVNQVLVVPTDEESEIARLTRIYK